MSRRIDIDRIVSRRIDIDGILTDLTRKRIELTVTLVIGVLHFGVAEGELIFRLAVIASRMTDSSLGVGTTFN